MTVFSKVFNECRKGLCGGKQPQDKVTFGKVMEELINSSEMPRNKKESVLEFAYKQIDSFQENGNRIRNLAETRDAFEKELS